ncbi:MAG: HI0074 family nucleotidyltransferase substrate-binding subunit [Hyphomicrobiaceae bacterium]
MNIVNPLESALAQLKTNYDLIGSDVARDQPKVKAAFRTASIKSFEYAYELSIRLIRRRLESSASTAQEIEGMDFKPLMRTAAEKGLVDDPVAWFLYREKRNITSHTYDETKAMDVVSVLPEFLQSAYLLLTALKAPVNAPG